MTIGRAKRNVSLGSCLSVEVEMLWGIRAFVLMIALAAAGSALAADKAVDDCQQAMSGGTDWTRQISGCTTILERGQREPQRTRSSAHNNRGLGYQNLGEHDRAIRDFDESIRLDPKNFFAYFNRAASYSANGEYDRALRDFDEVIRLRPKLVDAYVGRGIASYKKGDDDRALRDFDEAIRLNPKIAAGYAARGVVYYDRGDYDRALRALDEAIRLDPKLTAAYERRDMALAMKEKVGTTDSQPAAPGSEWAQEGSSQPSKPQQVAVVAPAPPPAVSTPQPDPPPSFSLPPSSFDETRVALIIGNARYAAQSPLKNPPNDAKAVAGALRGAGFQKVVSVEDLTRDKLVTALQEFQDEADRADWAVIYFSGHGIEVGGTNYVVPTDARLKTDRNISDEAVSLDRLMDSVRGARKLRMVILDACRDNPFAATMQRTITFRSASKGLGPIEPSRATLVVYAAKDGALAQDGAGSNSPFASALVKHLGTSRLEVSKLFRLVTDDVLDATGRQQQPFVYGSLPGREDFYFRP